MGDVERLYTLKEAVAVFFPGGNWTVASLRTEIRNGRLEPIRFAGKFGVTKSAIGEMLVKCREKQKAPASGSALQEKTEDQSGSFSTEALKQAQDALQATLKGLKKPSPPTSPKNTKRRKQAANLIELSSRMSSTST